MAIAHVATRGAQTYAAFGTSTTFTLTTPNTIAVGNTLIVFLAVDNAGPSGAFQFIQANFTMDPAAGSFLPIGNITNDPGVASEGVQIQAWMVKVGRTLNAAETITFTVANSIGRGVAHAREFSGVLVRSAPTDLKTVTGNGTTSVVPQITNVANGNLVIGMSGVETNAALTGDADVTGGAWVLANNAVSNSGVAATSISSIVQYKITSGGVTAQDWFSSWAGAADYAGMAIELSAAAAITPAEYPAENPHYPCIAGPEYLPTNSTTVPLDTGTGYITTFPWPSSSNGNTLFAATGNFVEPNARSQHIVSMELYTQQFLQASLSDDIETVVLPLREVATTDPLTAGVTTARLNAGPSPAGTVLTPANALTALASQGGDAVWFDGTLSPASIALFFDNAILANYVGYRVLRVGLRYLAWKDDSSPDMPGEGFDVAVGDTQTIRTSNNVGASALYGSWLVPEYKRNATYQTRWLGETNLVSRGGFNPLIANYGNNDVHPFTVVDLNRMANGVEEFFIRFTGKQGYDLLQTDVFLDHVEMVVELAPERRSYVNNRVVSNLINTGVDLYPFSATRPGILRYSLNPAIAAVMSMTPWAPMAFMVRQAFPATPSDRYRVATSGAFFWTFAEALGPPLEMYGADQLRGFPDVEEDLPQFLRGVLVNGLPEAYSFIQTNTIYSAFAFDPINYLIYGPFWVDAQQLSYPTFRWAAPGYTQSLTIQVGGSETYDKIRVFIKPGLLTTAPFTISIQQPLATPIATAVITVADWNAAGDPFELGDTVSYREVIVDLSVPITPSAGSVFIIGNSLDTDPWDIAGIRSNSGSTSYEWFEGTPSDADDPAMVLLCEMEDPDLDIDDVAVGNEDPLAPCVSAVIEAPQITINNADEYDQIVILRSIDGGVTLTALETIQVEGAPTIEWTDWGVPWDIEDIDYWVYGYRNSDRQLRTNVITWTGPATAPGAAFGLTDYDNLITVLYTPVSENELEVQWSPLNPISTVQLHGVDYQIALRSPEERGLSVSVVVAVRNFSMCSDTNEVWAGGETAAAGQRSFNPRPFDTLRYLENQCRLQLSMPGGHTRWVSLDLGTLSVRTVHGTYLAEITLTDLTTLPDSPYI